ncbi:MerR family transcriptional regulator [Demequina activiva]|uniref:MerR family transcriptional regulator n=1 Tax=Demequina activiva TaxID=1582364 RepID=A0A919UKC7_9MICO|nr:MerR family transcriptional regulator [Demequina activiva]GIG55151.1 MerR family transcriptional regulator [Demequina activiva]
MNEGLLGIGDFARHTRLSIKALRHYDDHGLLAPAHVDPVTRYRYYSPDQRARATLIGDLRRIDVPLAVVARILDASPGDALTVYQDWWSGQERRHADRRGIGRYVIARLRREGQPPMDIHTRTVPARKLAVISKELFQPELEEFIMSAFSTLFEWAERHPGLRALDTTPEEPTYVIFHGPVSPDASAVVEVCVVIDGPAEPEGDIVLRREDEHAEAYVPATKAGIEYPAILAAYDAVAAWVSEHGEMIASMPSREVYVADVLAAAAEDVVCEIAFPYRPSR